MANYKESMSAFIDNELNEIETHRFLRLISKEKNDIESYGAGAGDQKSLITSFLTFMSIRTSMLQQSYSQPISVDEHEALFQRISSAIEKEPSADEWRVLHTGMQVDFDSIFGDEAPEAGLMSFADWVIALSPCFTFISG